MQRHLTISSMVLVGMSLVRATSAFACPVCIAYPQKSAADHLIESSCVVFARENPDEPFSFEALEVLKGSLSEKPDLFVNSLTRRILNDYPKRFAVLAQDRETKAWRNLGLADDEYAAVVRRILLFAPDWQGLNGSRRRAEFFVSLFGHENPHIHRLAYLEMGRAPYYTIKQLSRTVSREQIDRVLQNRQFFEWRPLAILMLAQVGDAKDRKYLVDSFNSVARFRLTRNLGALATALIEVNATEAVALIESRYFKDPERTQEELVEVVKALSLHGTEGRTELRDRIVASYAILLKTHPKVAPQVAADLIKWKRPDLIRQISQIQETGSDLSYADTKVIRLYLKLVSTGDASAQIND